MGSCSSTSADNFSSSTNIDCKEDESENDEKNGVEAGKDALSNIHKELKNPTDEFKIAKINDVLKHESLPLGKIKGGLNIQKDELKIDKINNLLKDELKIHGLKNVVKNNSIPIGKIKTGFDKHKNELKIGKIRNAFEKDSMESKNEQDSINNRFESISEMHQNSIQCKIEQETQENEANDNNQCYNKQESQYEEYKKEQGLNVTETKYPQGKVREVEPSPDVKHPDIGELGHSKYEHTILLGVCQIDDNNWQQECKREASIVMDIDDKCERAQVDANNPNQCLKDMKMKSTENSSKKLLFVEENETPENHNSNEACIRNHNSNEACAKTEEEKNINIDIAE